MVWACRRMDYINRRSYRKVVHVSLDLSALSTATPNKHNGDISPAKADQSKISTDSTAV